MKIKNYDRYKNISYEKNMWKESISSKPFFNTFNAKQKTNIKCIVVENPDEQIILIYVKIAALFPKKTFFFRIFPKIAYKSKNKKVLQPFAKSKEKSSIHC